MLIIYFGHSQLERSLQNTNLIEEELIEAMKKHILVMLKAWEYISWEYVLVN